MQVLHHALIPALWLLWLTYWIIAAWHTKPVRRPEGLSSKLSHLILLVAGIAIMNSPRLAGAMLSHRFMPQAAWPFWLGAALTAAGIAFAVWARVHLAGNWSGTVTLKEDHSLTRDGPYRLVRHPIYTGILLGLLGSAIADGEWRDLVGLALITLSFLRKVVLEERILSAQFGDAYALYRAEVPALIPRP